MSFILRSSLRTIRSAYVHPLLGKRDFTRTITHMVNKNGNIASSSLITIHKPSLNCVCGCAGASKIHTKGEKELVEFLTEEIVAERKTQKSSSLPTEVGGFKVKLNGADVELIKENDKEVITVSFNVNHTVDSEEVEPETNAQQNEKFGEMKSKPTFEVDVKKGNRTLSFTCSFLTGEAQDGEYQDVFGIDEITIYDGIWSDKVYAVAGDVLDGYLYDLLMNLLEEKGVSNEFVEKLSEFSTSYEHSAYIGLLEALSKFTVETK